MSIYELLNKLFYDILEDIGEFSRTNEGSVLIKIILVLVVLYIIYTKVKTWRYY